MQRQKTLEKQKSELLDAAKDQVGFKVVRMVETRPGVLTQRLRDIAACTQALREKESQLAINFIVERIGDDEELLNGLDQDELIRMHQQNHLQGWLEDRTHATAWEKHIATYRDTHDKSDILKTVNQLE